MLRLTLIITFGVINLLNAPAAGNVILGGGNLKRTVERQHAGALHQTLAKRAHAHNHGAVQILKASGYNLRCRC